MSRSRSTSRTALVGASTHEACTASTWLPRQISREGRQAKRITCRPEKYSASPNANHIRSPTTTTIVAARSTTPRKTVSLSDRGTSRASVTPAHAAAKNKAHPGTISILQRNSRKFESSLSNDTTPSVRRGLATINPTVFIQLHSDGRRCHGLPTRAALLAAKSSPHSGHTAVSGVPSSEYPQRSQSNSRTADRVAPRPSIPQVYPLPADRVWIR